MAQSSDNDTVQLPPEIDNNQTRTYYALDKAMIRAHRLQTDEGDEKAISNARTLVEDADVPLIIRVRACMVLGCSEEDDFLKWAEEGVRVGELCMQVAKNPGEAEETLLRNAKEIFEGAKEAKAAKKVEEAEEKEVKKNDDGEDEK